MEKYHFTEGQEIQAIYWDDDSFVLVGRNGIEKITVVLEYGQMAKVPWFLVWKNGKPGFKHNAALVLGVAL